MTDCDGQQLTSLPSSSLPPTASTTEASHHLLHHLTSLRAHLFFMRLDYQVSPGLPCRPAATVPELARQYRRVDHAITEVTCQVLHTVFPAAPVLGRQVEVEDLLRAPLHHYTACPARMVRDCLVLARARATLAQFRAALGQ